jgi:hypothetical protein
MVDALNQAVETAEAQTDTSLSHVGSDGVSAPASASPATPTPEVKPANGAPAKASSTGIPEPDRGGPLPPLDDALFPPCALNDRYLIYPSKALPDLNSPQALAYKAEDRREPGRPVFALICKPGLPIRTGLLKELRAQGIRGLLPMLDFGPLFWSPIDQTTIAIVFDRPLGGRMLQSTADRFTRITEYEISKVIFEPLSQAISELAAINYAHRAIRLDNLFYMDKERKNLVLGECLTSPPGFDQPAIYEPLNRAFAMPSGRGDGMIYDDMYALGILSLFVLQGNNPAARYSDDEMLSAKAEKGTYQAMCENERITASLIEPVRGLLADEEFERWNIEALDQWLNGQRKTPIQRRPATKPKAPFKFGARDHMTVRSIAQAFSKNVPEAIKIIRSGKLEHWLRTSIDAPEIADSLLEIMTIPKGHEASLDAADDVLVSKVCMRLDPHGPIRYKHFSFLPDGFGVAMAVEYLRKGNFQIPGEVLTRDLIGFWASVHEKKTVEISAIERSFVSLRNFSRINEMGYGMERCLYELNQTLPCQSPLLNKTYVDHIDDFLSAMDEIADHTDKRSRPMDKHIAAFIDTHFKYDVTPHMKALSDAHEETSLIGLLSLYALMQWRMKVPALYGLSSWLGGLLAPAIGTYHSRTTRRHIEQEIPALVRQGSLPELFDLIDNADRRTVDNSDFEAAQIAFAHAEEEIDGIVGEGIDQKKVALEAGERTTAMLAITLSMIATTVIIFATTM